MLDLIEYCHNLEQAGNDPPDYLKILQDKGKIPSGVESIDELNNIQKEWIE